MFCCALLYVHSSIAIILMGKRELYVHSSIAIILMGKRELVALLNLSSWCLVVVGRLFLAVPRGCLQFVIVVFPDHTPLLFSKAFDKVNHSKLLWKLHQYGIRGHVLDWVRAFLWSRSQRVVIDGEESGSIPVTSGVPQGSVLGPILFLIYINDLSNEVCSQVWLFADDTALYLTSKSEDDSSTLQNDLNILSAWETRWDMGFNPSKCQVVHVTGSKKPVKKEITYCMDRSWSLSQVRGILGWISLVPFPGIHTSTG